MTLMQATDWPDDAVVLLRRDPDGFTEADLDALPDDGRRHELLDGVIVMTPSPQHDHQRGVARLLFLLMNAAPEDWEVLTAPMDVRLSIRNVLEPDLLVVPRVPATAPIGLPVLVVEALSPSTRLHDLEWKRGIYARGGIASYWLLDPREPSLTVLRLGADGYQEVARVTGDEAYEATEPFSVRVVPNELLV